VSHDARTAEVVGEVRMARYRPCNLKPQRLPSASEFLYKLVRPQ
jgi:hypothetical protein